MMLRKLVATMISALASLTVFVAYTGVSPNSWFIIYEPDIPDCLKYRD